LAKKRCAICDFIIPKNKGITSSFTGHSYCTNLDDCHRRAGNRLTINEIVERANEQTQRLRDADSYT